MFFIFIMLFSLILATVSIYAYTASLGLLKPWQRILAGIFVTTGFIGTFWISRVASPNYIVAFLYFLAWMAGGTILYSTIMLPVLGILSGITWKINRHDIRITGTWIILAIAFGLSIIGIEQRTWIKITKYSIPTDQEALQETTFAVVADPQFNIANNKQFARRITRKLATLDYDALLLPGDVFDGAKLDWRSLESEFKKWSEKSPVFMIPGNHEEYGDYNEFMDIMRRNGMVTLEDEVVSWNGISIAGFKYYGRDKELLGQSIITNLFEQAKPNNPIIVMNHEPRYQELFANYNADLVIYGHTHGGQFWPLKYIVQRIYGDYWYGKNTIDDTTFITSSGLGLAAFPSRLFNTPEIVVIQFVAQ